MDYSTLSASLVQVPLEGWQSHLKTGENVGEEKAATTATQTPHPSSAVPLAPNFSRKRLPFFILTVP